MKNQFTLFRERTFWPLFVTQFITAFNDNLCKTIFSVIIAYGVWTSAPWQPEVLVSIAASIFILPFILIGPLAGNIADKYDKSKIIKIIKWAELIIVILGIAGLYTQSINLMLVVLFLLGGQSAFFSPNKFGIMPQHLKPNQLMAGNGLLNTGTYLSVLFGLILGSILATITGGIFYASILMCVCTLIGLWSSYKVPHAPPTKDAKNLKLNWNTPAEALKIFTYIYQEKNGVLHALLGSILFFFISGLLIGQLPNYTAIVLKTDTFTLAFLMTIFSIGISVGGLMNNRLLKGKVEATLVPFAVIGIALVTIDLFFATATFAQTHPTTAQALHPIATTLTYPAFWRIMLDFLLLSIFGGLYIVPLKAYVQHNTNPSHTARIISAGGLIDATSILASSTLAAILLSNGWTIPQLFLIVIGLCFIFAPYMTILWPQHIRDKFKRP